MLTDNHMNKPAPWVCTRDGEVFDIDSYTADLATHVKQDGGWTTPHDESLGKLIALCYADALMRLIGEFIKTDTIYEFPGMENIEWEKGVQELDMARLHSTRCEVCIAFSGDIPLPTPSPDVHSLTGLTDIQSDTDIVYAIANNAPHPKLFLEAELLSGCIYRYWDSSNIYTRHNLAHSILNPRSRFNAHTMTPISDACKTLHTIVMHNIRAFSRGLARYKHIMEPLSMLKIIVEELTCWDMPNTNEVQDGSYRPNPFVEEQRQLYVSAIDAYNKVFSDNGYLKYRLSMLCDTDIELSEEHIRITLTDIPAAHWNLYIGDIIPLAEHRGNMPRNAMLFIYKGKRVFVPKSAFDSAVGMFMVYTNKTKHNCGPQA